MDIKQIIKNQLPQPLEQINIIQPKQLHQVLRVSYSDIVNSIGLKQFTLTRQSTTSETSVQNFHQVKQQISKHDCLCKIKQLSAGITQLFQMIELCEEAEINVDVKLYKLQQNNIRIIKFIHSRSKAKQQQLQQQLQ
ncbi:Hypothetical_protein [Hexamita inflata]|uniref:Hypothetical_protein n=1 Tax=Hexamita inflata TaxID=28002 RepID=A0AA86R6V5_9EUKA|nr:Hypothetical protein HINF_LOCUS57463 [Hexamita inflata]CAI9969824.1 Hypothetical protein HINF_LOCUS57469 [Hexamita inflata]